MKSKAYRMLHTIKQDALPRRNKAYNFTNTIFRDFDFTYEKLELYYHCTRPDKNCKRCLSDTHLHSSLSVANRWSVGGAVVSPL